MHSHFWDRKTSVCPWSLGFSLGRSLHSVCSDRKRKRNRGSSLSETLSSCLSISQFTILANSRSLQGPAGALLNVRWYASLDFTLTCLLIRLHCEDFHKQADLISDAFLDLSVNVSTLSAHIFSTLVRTKTWEKLEWLLAEIQWNLSI